MPNPVRDRRLFFGGNAVMAHRAAQFQGAQSLANPNSSNQFNLSAGTTLGTVGFWFRLDAFAANYQKMFALGDPAGAASDQWAVQINGSTQNVTSVYSNGAGYNAVEQAGFVATLGQWFLVFAGPGTGSTIYINLYDQAGPLAGGSAGAIGPINQPTHQPLQLGAGKGGVSPFTGTIDSFGIWPSRLLTAPEQTAIWNNGKALDFAHLPASALVGLALWADLDDASGALTWTDATGGGNPLTATGAVLSVKGAGF